MTEILGGPSKISDETLTKKTGKSSAEWYAILDSWEAPEKKYYTMTKYLENELKLNHWWANVIVIRYEYEKGIRR